MMVRIPALYGALAVIGPLLGTVAALALAVAWGGVSTSAVWLTFALYVLTALGIEVGYHRLFTHRAFKCAPATRFGLGVLAAMAGEGPVFFWVATHREHHRFCDKDGDPHSPHPAGFAAFWHAHIGWLIQAGDKAAPKDLIADPTSRLLDRTYLVWFSMGLVLPAVIGSVFDGSRGALEGFLWGGLVRMFLCHQFSWSLNSLAHLIGARPYTTTDGSRNVWFLALPTLGAAWHNNHHAFPTSASNDHEWWQLDLSAWIIRAAERAGLVWDVRKPKLKLSNVISK